MLDRRHLLLGGAAMIAFATQSNFGKAEKTTETKMAATATGTAIDFKKISDEEWKTRLSPAQYQVLRKHGTERPGTSPLNQEKRKGTFACAGCELPLFSSETKYESGTGWPSFYRPLPDAVGTKQDRSLFTTRTEVHCGRCLGHLGHVFDDGPKPTGLRYCMNGVALKFVPEALKSS